MTFSEDGSSLKRFRKNPLPFEKTYLAPQGNAEVFVAGIIAALHPVHGAELTVDHVVFEPQHLKAFAACGSIHPGTFIRCTLAVIGEMEAQSLLQAALTDSIDFLFMPTPRHLVIYADHDEYITFFGAKKSHLSQVKEFMQASGIPEIENYRRW